MASDFHTHTPHPGKRELVDGGVGRAPLWSLPFHPWNTQEPLRVPDEELRACAALGELGFDRFRGAARWPEEQLSIFGRLLELAAEFDKPVVIHAAGPLEQLFKAVRPFPRLRLLLHGFAKRRTEMLDEVLKRNFFVTLNPGLLENEAFLAYLKSHPSCRVGLETDADDRYAIEELYQKVRIPGFEERADELFGEFLGL